MFDTGSLPNMRHYNTTLTGQALFQEGSARVQTADFELLLAQAFMQQVLQSIC